MHGGKNKFHSVLAGLSSGHKICLKLKGRLVPLRPIMSFRLVCLKLVSLSRRINFAISFKKAYPVLLFADIHWLYPGGC